MNKVILLGRVGQEPENNNGVVKLSLATSEKYTDKQGEKQEKTEWHNIVFFGKLAEIVEKYIKKGSQILIEGKINYHNYEKDGTKMYYTSIVANNMQMLGGNQNNQGNNTPPPPKNQEVDTSENSDGLPF